jgi:redox-sensitive bicupin YhaK (pirin superfamily)
MITVRSSQERGSANFGWLDSRHTFSFGEYYDSAHMGFASLRVINEDRVAPGKGFATHGHRDMEIISYVLDGALEHQDSIGNGSIIRPGDVQRMSAGKGIQHSEYNHSPTDEVHFLQIWIVPEVVGIEPGYEQKNFSAAEKKGNWRLLGSREGRDGSILIHQDIDFSAAILENGKTIDYTFATGRVGWLQVARGTVSLNDSLLSAGDGAAIHGETIVVTSQSDDTEVLLFDMVA